MQLLTFDGILSGDAKEIKTKKGTRFAGFTVGSDSFARGLKKTTWYEVVCCVPYVVDVLMPFLKKGAHVQVVGEPDSMIEMSPTGVPRIKTSVLACHVSFVSSGTKNDTDTAKPAEPEVPYDE